MYNVYIGWDSKEPIAYDVCKYSINRESSIDVNTIPLIQNELRERQLYWRDQDIGSTEFTITRFLVPYLNGYSGIALFCDCDFLYVEDIKKLFDQFDPSKAIQVVKHEYDPVEDSKFLGNVQHKYPKKNWSSLMLFNCDHPGNKALTLDCVNQQPPSYLHQLKWLDHDDIGELSHEWNWLEGHYREPQDGSPKAIHYTRGGPWFEECAGVEYADDWNQALQELNKPRGE